MKSPTAFQTAKACAKVLLVPKTRTKERERRTDRKLERVVRRRVSRASERKGNRKVFVGAARRRLNGRTKLCVRIGRGSGLVGNRTTRRWIWMRRGGGGKLEGFKL